MWQGGWLFQLWVSSASCETRRGGVSGGGAIFPGASIAQQDVGGDDAFAHDGYESDFMAFAFFFQATIEGGHFRVMHHGDHGGHEQDIAGPAASTTDMASSFEGPPIAGEGGDAKKGGGLAIAHGAEFAHPGDQGGGLPIS